ncbi:MAG: omptin family outer membrane protease [Spirochaetes bacterium]|jgi:hypothetical protein|nr:omptin family outer membrane protease [Spirochaetota bacterium]
MKKILLPASLFLLILASVPSLFAQEKTRGQASSDIEINVEAGAGKYLGFTKSQTGGLWKGISGFYPYWFPASELRFPLDTWMFNGNISMNFFKFFSVQSGVKKSLKTGAGKMKESGWGFPGAKTAYADSDSKIKAVFSDTDLAFSIFSAGPLSLKLGAGFLYQNYEISCSNLVRWELASGSPSISVLRGKNRSYKLEYFIPYVEVLPVFRFMENKLSFTTGFKYSPLTRATDVDDYILNGKKSKGKGKGHRTYMGLFNAKYVTDSGIFFTLGLDYLYLLTNGVQKQYYYISLLNLQRIVGGSIQGGYNGKLENKNESQQISINLGVGYSFGL